MGKSPHGDGLKRKVRRNGLALPSVQELPSVMLSAGLKLKTFSAMLLVSLSTTKMKSAQPQEPSGTKSPHGDGLKRKVRRNGLALPSVQELQSVMLSAGLKLKTFSAMLLV